MNIGPLIVWVVALTSILSFGTALWTIFSGPARKAAVAQAELEKRLDIVERLQQRLADRVEGMPDQETMHRLEISMTRMEGHIEKLDERLKPVTAIAERMQDILIEQGRP